MKLVSASFDNFRLLRDFAIKFATDKNANLTVIRAENESGKTTVHVALQWVLFGEEALPGRWSKEYRLHPVDWEEDEVEIVGEVEFVHAYKRREGDTTATDKDRYLAQRKVRERILGPNEWQRSEDRFQLFRITDEGYRPEPEGELKVRQILESNLKDLFFTDGDRALTFISSDLRRGEKREMVREALRDMLGLELLEKAQGHLKSIVSDLRSAVGRGEGERDIDELAGKLDELEQQIEDGSEELAEKRRRLVSVSEQISEIRARINDALRKGNRQELADEQEEVEQLLGDLKNRRKDLAKEHASLFFSRELTYTLSREQIRAACEHLDQLKDQGKIPRTAVPMLEEALESGECICGRKLEEGSHPYQRVNELIDEQRQRSDTEERLTQLRFSGRQMLGEFSEKPNVWMNQLGEVVERRSSVDDRLESARTRAKELEGLIDQVEEADVDWLREQEKKFEDTKGELQRKIGSLEADLSNWNEEHSELERKWEKLTKQQEQSKRGRARLHAAQDLRKVLKATSQEIEQNEIPAVSKAMNQYFLRMIQADPEQNAIIREASVSDTYDIKVKGTKGRILDTDRDLNGASRRALTLSFLLGLAEVSGVTAPNVIDTPLGMTSGEVKRSIVDTLTESASQLVLFLTRAEIRDCEDILDRSLGAVSTMTNTAHYPSMLANEPATHKQAVVTCSCSIGEYCDVCKRVGDDERSHLRYRKDEHS